MAKQGFATSDRRKVELLGAAKPLGIQVHDCGTVFVLSSGLELTHTLPSAAACGEGWWIRVVEGVDRPADAADDGSVTFAAASDTESGAAVITGVDGTQDAVTYTEPGGVPTVTFVANVSDVGDEVEILVANGQWFVRGVCGT